MTQFEKDALAKAKQEKIDELDVEIVDEDNNSIPNNTNNHEEATLHESEGQFFDALGHAANELDVQLSKQNKQYLGAGTKTIVDGIRHFAYAYRKRNSS